MWPHSIYRKGVCQKTEHYYVFMYVIDVYIRPLLICHLYVWILLLFCFFFSFLQACIKERIQVKRRPILYTYKRSCKLYLAMVLLLLRFTWSSLRESQILLSSLSFFLGFIFLFFFFFLLFLFICTGIQTLSLGFGESNCSFMRMIPCSGLYVL